MKNLHIQTSGLTNNIYCGSVSKDGTEWLSNKTDVTNEAICAVIDHAIVFEKRSGEKLTLTSGGKRYTVNIIVEDV